MSASILYEVQNLTLRGATGIATYARSLAKAAGRLGYEANALIGVERDVSLKHGRLNEVLAFDAVSEDELEAWWQVALRVARYPFNALGGLTPVALQESGLVISPLAEQLRSFQNFFVSTRLVDAAAAHFKIYGRLAKVRLEVPPSLFHATHPVPLAVTGRPNVYTIHDLVPLRLPSATLENKKYFYRLLTKLAATADHIVTVSEHSRRDIIEFLGVDERRVTNTYQPLDIPEHLARRTDDEVAAELGLTFGLDFGGYFLFYGAIEPKKNLSRLIDAYAASGSKRPLVIAGSDGWQNRADLRKIVDERFQSFRLDGNVFSRHRQVRRLRYLPQGQLISLIQGARAVLFPSIYEGFGLPVVKSMFLGTPVLTSNVASLPEVAGNAALLVDPYSVDEIAKGIRALDVD